MGYFPTGVTIATTWRDAAPLGATINAFCSVSLEPPLLLICLAYANPLYGPLQACGVFGVNILAHRHGQALARHFAVSPEDRRFDDHDWSAEASGAPKLACAPVFIDCAFEAEHAAGDHAVIIGRGVRVSHEPGVPPLLYHRGTFPGPLSDV